jgi:hypothetical protein
MRRRLTALFFVIVSFVLTLSSATSASAAVVRDGDKFSVDTGPARICWVTPLELRNAEDCEGLSPDLVADPNEDGEARIFAKGLVRLERPGEEPELGLVLAMHVEVAFTVEPDEQTAKDFAGGAEKGLAKHIRKGATMRPANVRVVKPTYPQKHSLIRLVLETDGIPEGAEDQLLEHHVQLAGMADDGVYAVAFFCKRRHAKQVEAVADSLRTSFTMAKPAMSNKQFEKKMEAIGSVVVLVGTLIVGGIISLIVVMSRRNKPAPYAYPHPYQSQSSYPPPAWHPASAQHGHQPQYAPQPQPQPQYQPRHYSIPPAPAPPPGAPRREWWDELQ